MSFILGKKLNMGQIFDETGKVLPVTYIQAGPVKVVQVKKEDGKDGYNAVQIGYGKKKNLSNALKGHMKDLGNFRFLREFRVKGDQQYEVGQEIKADMFTVGSFVDVTGVMKGRGFAGAMKRHGFRGAPASHGHDHPRAVGSIGQMFPQHVRKGLRMAGHMGASNVTVRNLKVVAVDTERNIIAVRGAVPGANGNMVKVSASIKQPKVDNKEE